MKLKSKTLALILLTWLLIITLSSQTGLSELQPEDNLVHVIVFKRGEDGYHTYRIPSIVQAKDGTLIAFAEGRRDKGSDPGGGHIDLVYKFSQNGGRTWSSLCILEKSQEGGGASNPTTVLENSSGRIIVLYDVWVPGRGQGSSRPGTLDNELRMRFSNDNGRTWSDAKDITQQGRDVEHWSYTGFGPGCGIETRTGRLVIPAYANALELADDDPSKRAAFALYSDNGGLNWKRGKQINVNTNENQIVELDDGRLMVDARQSDRTLETRWVAISNDQGETWSEPEKGQVCDRICAGIVRYPRTGESSLLLWSGIKGPGRANLILRLSSDQGRSFPVELLIGKGPAAYSVLTLIDKTDIGILWEGGKENTYEKIIFTLVPKKIIINLNRLAIMNRNIH